MRRRSLRIVTAARSHVVSKKEATTVRACLHVVGSEDIKGECIYIKADKSYLSFLNHFASNGSAPHVKRSETSRCPQLRAELEDFGLPEHYMASDYP